MLCLAGAPSAPFGERLRAFRLAAGLTAGELAGLVGVVPETVHGYERDEAQRLPWTVLLKLAGVTTSCRSSWRRRTSPSGSTPTPRRVRSYKRCCALTRRRR